jgi:hypothetical protein
MSRYDNLRRMGEAKFAAKTATAKPAKTVTEIGPRVTELAANSVTPQRAKPGPKPSGKALSRAEIQRRYRQRRQASL